MRASETLRVAAASLASHRGRSALTVLSITIGAFAIVVMSSLASSGLLTLERGIEEIGGARLLLIVQKKPERGETKQAAYSRGLTRSDRERAFRELPHVRAMSMFSRLGRSDVMTDSGARATSHLVAADPRFFDVFRMRIERGRAFSEDEDRGRAAVCVVGHKLAANVGWTAAAVGRVLTVGPLRCRVIGVLADNDRFGVNFGFDWTDLVIAPSETVGDLDSRVRERASVLVQTDDPSSNELVKRLVNARLSARHPNVDDFTMFDFSGFMKRFQTVFASMEVIVGLLASVALLIGGVGVMNMMLVAVSERVREVGLRKALGARPREIGAQFLAEAVLLSIAGGGSGVAAGLLVAVGASRLIGRFVTTWQLSLAPSAAVTALVVSMGIGALFGWLPARQAAALDPVKAMRG